MASIWGVFFLNCSWLQIVTRCLMTICSAYCCFNRHACYGFHFGVRFVSRVACIKKILCVWCPSHGCFNRIGYQSIVRRFHWSLQFQRKCSTSAAFILKDFRSDFACFDLFIITLWLICCGSSLGAGSHRAKRSDKGLEQKNNRSVASGSFHRIALPHQVVVVQFVARILHAGHQLKATYVESAGKERQSSVATTVVC